MPTKRGGAEPAAQTAETWIAFLRAVNVGGRKAPMAQVRELFAELGLGAVRSYIASGNVFFTLPEAPAPAAAMDRPALTLAIEEKLRAGLGFDVPVMLRTASELEAALLAAPFDQVEVTPEVRLSVVFLSAPLEPGLTFPVRSPKGDWELLGATDGEAFVVIRLEQGKLGGNPIAVLEKTYQVRATARFFHTAGKILAAARQS
ncbi:DUF1697 domain-containing protein [Streptacidiphilus sp. N1-3]|uniref:DUF1697 domain-containing protein n=1 Tax=Streptacidiphilus alkalitolerans TaxID=3342712 RepID=A0ABV6WVC2_9ACTN